MDVNSKEANLEGYDYPTPPVVDINFEVDIEDGVEVGRRYNVCVIYGEVNPKKICYIETDIPIRTEKRLFSAIRNVLKRDREWSGNSDLKYRIPFFTNKVRSSGTLRELLSRKQTKKINDGLGDIIV